MYRTFVSNTYSTLLCLSLVICSFSRAQLTLDSCYHLAERNYPLIKNAFLIAQSESYNLANIQKGYLPQITITSQATYQSDVTGISGIPNIKLEPLSKDQYKIVANVSQNIYDGGTLHVQKQLQSVSSDLENANLTKDLYNIKERINQIFFGALLLNVQLKQNDILIQQLKESSQRVDSMIANGESFKSDADQLAGDILTQQQHGVDLQSGISTYLNMLDAFIGKHVDSVQEFVYPNSIRGVVLDSTNSRPELAIFQLQNKLYSAQQNLISARMKPRFSLFGDGGYGKPGLNFLKNEFTWFYMAGIKLNWNFSTLYTYRNEKRLLQNNINRNNVQRETFLFNNNLTLIQQNNEEQKILKLLGNDKEIIRLRENTSKAAKAKYENGVTTLNDYTKALNEVQQAQLNYELHKIQTLLNQYNKQLTLGK